jgi:hypothetical protein
MNQQTHTKRKAILAGIDTEGYLLCSDGTSEILAVLTDKQSMNGSGSVSATVTPHVLTPNGKTSWRRAIVSGDSEVDIIRRYVKAQQTTVREAISREDLEGHLIKTGL